MGFYQLLLVVIISIRVHVVASSLLEKEKRSVCVTFFKHIILFPSQCCWFSRVLCSLRLKTRITTLTTCLLLWQDVAFVRGPFLHKHTGTMCRVVMDNPTYTQTHTQTWSFQDGIIRLWANAWSLSVQSGDRFPPFSSSCNLVQYTSSDSWIKWSSFHNGHYETNCGTKDLALCVKKTKWAHSFAASALRAITETVWSPGQSCHIRLIITIAPMISHFVLIPLL